ncbi:MAG: hypothetical protein VX035_08905, partial [Planctomycetota bacterium]|nr:hypothetical protein [Planctomycetota bacterium]
LRWHQLTRHVRTKERLLKLPGSVNIPWKSVRLCSCEKASWAADVWHMEVSGTRKYVPSDRQV